jgi:hypothetical protein
MVDERLKRDVLAFLETVVEYLPAKRHEGNDEGGAVWFPMEEADKLIERLKAR